MGVILCGMEFMRMNEVILVQSYAYAIFYFGMQLQGPKSYNFW